MDTPKSQLNKQALLTFKKRKVLTVEHLMKLLICSSRTVRTRLRQWKAISSYNKNGKFYTLPSIAKFNESGLWSYDGINFSDHGSLKKTLVYLVENSDEGLDSKDIGELLKMNPQSFLSHFKDHPSIYREKISGRYVYFSTDRNYFLKQRDSRLLQAQTQRSSSVKDVVAIQILVERIKHPDVSEKVVSKRLQKQGVSVKPEKILAFYEFHGIEKKTPDS